MISGIVTAVLMTGFLAIAGWAWSSRNREKFERAALQPLQDEGAAPAGGDRKCCCGKEDEA